MNTTKGTTSPMPSTLVTSVCEDNYPPIDSKVSNVCCIPRGCTEGCRESIEVFKALFHIVSTPDCSFSHQVFGVIMRACIILYNMIIEDERGKHTL